MTEADIQALEELVNVYLECGSKAFIGKKFGACGGQQVSLTLGILRKAGLDVPNCGRPGQRRFNLAAAVRLLSEGASTSHIARTFCMTRGSVNCALRRAGILTGRARREVEGPKIAVDRRTSAT